MKLPEYKAVVVGVWCGRKSALTIQLNNQCFVEDHDPTIQDSYWKEMALDHGGCILNVLTQQGWPLIRPCVTSVWRLAMVCWVSSPPR